VYLVRPVLQVFKAQLVLKASKAQLVPQVSKAQSESPAPADPLDQSVLKAQLDKLACKEFRA
jgi:hypothetical protein